MYEQTALEILQTLTRLQFPPLVMDSESQFQNENPRVAMMKLNKFIEGGDSRLMLLSWLLSRVNSQWATSQRATRQQKINSIKLHLSCLGLIPISKHSKNMDIDRYIMGMLGPESAISLVLKMCRFVKRCQDLRSKDHVDFNIVPMIRELCLNKQNLVDQQYDPFSISFPPVHLDLPEHEFIDKWKEIKVSIATQEAQMRVPREVDQSFLEITPELTLRYKAALGQLTSIIDRTPTKKSVDSPDVSQQHRMVPVSRDFLEVYRQFSKATTISTEQSSTVGKQIQKIRKALNNI